MISRIKGGVGAAVCVALGVATIGGAEERRASLKHLFDGDPHAKILNRVLVAAADRAAIAELQALVEGSPVTLGLEQWFYRNEGSCLVRKFEIGGSRFSSLYVSAPDQTEAEPQSKVILNRVIGKQSNPILVILSDKDGRPETYTHYSYFEDAPWFGLMRKREVLDPDFNLVKTQWVNPLRSDSKNAQCASFAKPGPLQEAEVPVAVLDTGIDYFHPMVSSRILLNEADRGHDEDRNGYIADRYGWDFEDNDNDPYDYYIWDDEYRRHGTSVAGVIAQAAPMARLIPVRFPRLKYSDFRKAIEYAAKRGARIVNVSLAVRETLDAHALRKGMEAHPEILFVVGVGNDDGNNLDAKSTVPAHWHLPNMIAVTVVDSHGIKPKWADWGPRTVHTAALGVDVQTATSSCEYGTLTGSSFATPLVTALAARVMSEVPKASVDQVKRALAAGVIKTPGLRRQTEWGGYLDPEQSWPKIVKYLNRP